MLSTNIASPRTPLQQSPPTTRARASLRLSKGEKTKETIVRIALRTAARYGLESLSIGALATSSKMSKSGVFAHFGSREALQLCVIREYGQIFETQIIHPGLAVPRGLPRVVRLFSLWLERALAEAASGCLYLKSAIEFENKPGPVRDLLQQSTQIWLTILRTAIEKAQDEGHIRQDLDADDLLLLMQGLVLSIHFQIRLCKNAKLTAAHIHSVFTLVLEPWLTGAGKALLAAPEPISHSL